MYGRTDEDFLTLVFSVLNLFSRKFYERKENGEPYYYSPYNGKIYDGYMYTDNGFLGYIVCSAIWGNVSDEYNRCSMAFIDSSSFFIQVMEGFKFKMKNGLNFEIPVNGMTEDVEQFRLLIGKE